MILLEKHLHRIEKQGLNLQKLLQYSFQRLDELEIDVDQRNLVHPLMRLIPVPGWLQLSLLD